MDKYVVKAYAARIRIPGDSEDVPWRYTAVGGAGLNFHDPSPNKRPPTREHLGTLAQHIVNFSQRLPRIETDVPRIGRTPLLPLDEVKYSIDVRTLDQSEMDKLQELVNEEWSHRGRSWATAQTILKRMRRKPEREIF